ncbi:MAG TPA: RDD family protein [Pseudonocardiaceae bacterium]|nr:RDD family protein [Pseudonocardiaceae bacterium]
MTVDDEPWEPAVRLTEQGDTRVIGLRAVQFAVDVLLVQVVAVALAAVVALVGVRLMLGSGRSLIATFVFVLVWLWLSLFGWVLVTVLWPAVHEGRTPAMRWFRLRVVTLEGDVPRPAALVMRCVLTLVDGFPFGLVGLVIMANSRRQQRLGDIVAGTLVVRDRR